MSLSLVPQPVVKAIDPRVNINNQRVYAVVRGPQENSYQPFPSTSFNNSQAQITCNPPSRDTIINRKIWVNATFNLTFGGTAGSLNTLLVPGQYDGVRNEPLAQILNTIQATINNDQVSSNYNQYSTAFARYHNCQHLRALDGSMSPSMPDSYQQYSDWEIYGSARNPLAYFGENSAEQSRGGFSGLTILTNTSTSATATLEVTEPIYLSPFLFHQHHDESGLIGVSNQSFTFTFGNLQRIWSHSDSNISPAPQGTITSLTVTLTSIQTLLQYMTPQLGTPIPQAITYPYAEITPYPTPQQVPLAAGSSTNLTLNNVQLKSIPRRMYVYARQRDQDIDATVASSVGHSDTFAVINNITVTFNNRVGMLSSSTQQDLYQMSVKNGCNSSWNEWSNNVGSVLCMDFGEDIGLPINQSPGLLGNYQMTFTVNISNTSAASITYALYAVVVNEGTMTLMNGSCQHMIGVLSPQDVLKADSAPEVSFEKAEHVYGGSFWDSLKKFGSDVASGFRKGRDFLKPVVSPILDAFPKDPRLSIFRGVTGYGLSGGRHRLHGHGMSGGMSDEYHGYGMSGGMSDEHHGYGMSGGRAPKHGKCPSRHPMKVKRTKPRKTTYCRKKRRHGGVLVGGELMTTSELKDRLMGGSIREDNDEYDNPEDYSQEYEQPQVSNYEYPDEEYYEEYY